MAKVVPHVLEGVLDPATLSELGGTVDLSFTASAPTLALDQMRGALVFDRADGTLLERCAARALQRADLELGIEERVALRGTHHDLPRLALIARERKRHGIRFALALRRVAPVHLGHRAL